jgi:VWFA-related protein
MDHGFRWFSDRLPGKAAAALMVLAGWFVPAHLPAQFAEHKPAPQTIDPDELHVSSDTYLPPAQSAFGSSVRLVEVLAVVRDSQGRPVAGLTRADFEVHDEGKKRELTAFSVQDAPAKTTAVAVPATAAAGQPAAAPAPATRPKRTIAMLFDDLNSKPLDFQQMRDGALRFVKSGLAPGDRVGVFTTSQAFYLPFTSDAAELAAAIAKLNYRERIGNNTMQCPYFSPYIAYVIENNLDPQALAAKVDELSHCTGAVVSAGRGKAAAAAPATYISPQSPQALPVIQMARIFMEEQDVTTQDTLDAMEDLVKVLAAQPGQRMLLLGSGGFFAGTLELRQEALIEHAVHAGVVINALDAKGLYTADLPPNGGNGSALSAVYAVKLGARDKDASNDAMENLAAGTGGKFFRNSNDLAAGYGELTEVPEVSYLLGFSPPAPDGKFHNLKVQVPGGKGYSIQARKGYTSEKESAPREERKIDREVFTTTLVNDAPVSLDLTLEPNVAGGNILRAVYHVGVKALPFVDQSGVKADKLSFLLVVLDKDGNFISGEQGAMEFALKQATFERLRDTRLDASLRLEMPSRAGTYRLRVLIEEANGGKMTEAMKVMNLQ